jgi:hypothetical protein
MHPQYRGVAFLLSLGTLPIACKSPDNTDTDASTGPATTSGTASNSTTGGDPTTGPVDPTTGNSNSGTTTTGDPDSSTGPGMTTFLTNNPSTSDGTEESGFPPPPPPENPVCIAYLEHLEMCMPGYRYNGISAYYCDVYIKYGLRYDGQACADAFEAAFTCFNGVECNLEMFEECAEEVGAAMAACPTFFGGETDTDTDSDSDSTDSSDTGGESSTGTTG